MRKKQWKDNLHRKDIEGGSLAIEKIRRTAALIREETHNSRWDACSRGDQINFTNGLISDARKTIHGDLEIGFKGKLNNDYA